MIIFQKIGHIANPQNDLRALLYTKRYRNAVKVLFYPALFAFCDLVYLVNKIINHKLLLIIYFSKFIKY